MPSFDLYQAVADIQSQPTVEEVCQMHFSYVQHYGIKYYIYLNTTDEDIRGFVLHHNWPKDVIKRYFEDISPAKDFVYHKARQMDLPFFWREEIFDNDISSDVKEFYKWAFNKYDINSGFMVPIHRANGTTAVFSMVGKDLQGDPKMMFDCTVMTHMAIGTIINLTNVGDVQATDDLRERVKKLTTTQTIALRYASMGFSYPQIAHAMGVKRQTVKNYIYDATVKLDVETREETIKIYMACA